MEVEYLAGAKAFVGGVGAVKTLLETGKLLKEGVEGVDKEKLSTLIDQIIALQSTLLEMQAAYMTLQDEYGKSQAEYAKLKEVAEKKGRLFYEYGTAWKEIDGGREGPYCKDCIHRKDKLVLMTLDPSEGYFYCPLVSECSCNVHNIPVEWRNDLSNSFSVNVPKPLAPAAGRE